MTDADVDGSHIRTLLLTFFFRQYPELLENGYLYIAQPPLYKVKRGKRETYLKNEQALEDFLLAATVDEVKVVGQGGKGRILEGADLSAFLRLALRYVKVRSHLDKRCDGRIIDALVEGADLGKADLVDRARVQALVEDKIIPYIAVRNPGTAPPVIELAEDREHGGVTLVAPARLGGRKRIELGWEFLDLQEYEELRRLRAQMDESAPAPYQIERNNERVEADQIVKLATTMEEMGRRGLTIQRYKGLGEMDAEQLWETTMDPERRTLMQVRVQDSVEADQIFTVLMGDLVEPRRAFIEKNALNVRNLDV
jgi:DNA gyrase subunit B